jgi:hypothetical protein
MHEATLLTQGSRILKGLQDQPAGTVAVLLLGA